MLSYQITNKDNISAERPPLQGISLFIIINLNKSGKRVYRTIPFCNNGSASVEAAVVIPLFIFASFAIFTICSILQTNEILYEGLQETAQYFAEYQYAENTLTEEILDDADISISGINSVSAHIKLMEYIDDSDAVDKYVLGGTSGLVFKEAYFDSDDGYVHLDFEYSINVDIPILGNVKLQEAYQVKQKAYLGFDTDGEFDEDDTYVYVTETGDVYHKSRDCYHIKLTIKKVSESSLSTTYANYDACELCALGRAATGNVYVTETGNKYHYSIACSGLKRTVSRVKLKDVNGLPPCSNCGN